MSIASAVSSGIFSSIVPVITVLPESEIVMPSMVVVAASSPNIAAPSSANSNRVVPSVSWNVPPLDAYVMTTALAPSEVMFTPAPEKVLAASESMLTLPVESTV